MNKTTFDLKQGIKAHFIKTDLYKTDLSCLIITTPLKRETVTLNALIPFMLRRGTKKLPNQGLINKELENMYGATFNCGIDKMGDNVILKFYIESISSEYALNSENILEMNLNNLLDIVFDPIQNDELLNEQFLTLEKENLKRVINRKIDDKDSYALDRCISAMYGDEKFGLYKYGYEEDVDKITIKDISGYYNWLIQNSKIDIFISGNIKTDEVEEFLKKNNNIKKLRPRIENYILNNEFTESKQIVENINEISEKMDVSQGKLVMGLDILSDMENLQVVALVYNAILGDGANSMMFQNVREKASLAYSARSTFVKQKLNIFIRCGIQIENYEKAIKIIKEQLENIKKGEFSDEDIQNAKTYLISSLKNVAEEQDTEVIYYIGQEISKTNMSLEEYIKKIETVTKEQVVELANSIQLNTIYFLKN
ncbi:MAG: insulinase family protein [Clostridia bacterium]|nr:insulinase family protein [Clostridia bacterium]